VFQIFLKVGKFAIFSERPKTKSVSASGWVSVFTLDNRLAQKSPLLRGTHL